MLKNTSKIIFIILISLLFLFFVFSLTIKSKNSQPITHNTSTSLSVNPQLVTISPLPTSTSLKEKAKVSIVYDGDTIELADKRKVRYIGINTPEINWKSGDPQCFATQSARINKEMVGGQEIEMAKDISETDKYGRILRYIWIDGIFMNDFLLRQGYAKLDLIPPDTSYSGQFKEAQKEARDNKRGLWGKCK